MLPSSLAIVLPARAVTTTAASTGASSRASASGNDAADHAFRAELAEADDRAQRERHAREHPDQTRR